MPRKQPNLKRRLEELSEEPLAPVELRLLVEASLHESLQQLAKQKRISLERYLERVLRNHVAETAE